MHLAPEGEPVTLIFLAAAAAQDQPRSPWLPDSTAAGRLAR